MPVVRIPAIPGLAEHFHHDTPEERMFLGPAGCDAGFSERVHVCGPCSSTLDVAMHLAGRGELDVWDSVLATRQWAGRGQLRRNWVSESGNLFAAWRLPVPPPEWQNMLSVLVGWVLCLGLGEFGVPIRLKWPNDLLLHGRKVGGILIEERGDVLLAGIGLNLVSCPDDADLRQDRACPAASLADFLSGMPILGLWLRLVNFGRLRYSAELSASTPLEFSQSIESVLAYFGSVVHVSDNRSSVCGVYSGISPDGGIVLDTGGERVTMHTGSLRPEE